MIFTKDDILFYIDNVRWKFRNSNIKASAVCDIIYAAIEQSEDVLYQQGYNKAKEDMINLLEGEHIKKQEVIDRVYADSDDYGFIHVDDIEKILEGNDDKLEES